ncbi:unnamed protein product [Paramecium primaurelia]|uniref:H-type lectin domain-containing protein n=1 Tax=Paramecium primaurelia TaxID=5886 RepID=A0A8S1PM06_PARPR|nr:unnamed protein product [Paramecium primaurelia]CAD8116495.1 unnamed protein product [Paramecium primaurelia]
MKVYLIIHIVYGIITYDSNTITSFAYQYSGGSKCISPQQRQKTVYFSDIFARPPKIILQTQMFDLQHPYLNFTLQIMTVTTDYFILHQKCDYSVVHGIVIRWQAMDDERIQVINEFNMISLENKTYSHINPNVEEAIISLINLSYKGSIKFNIEISELTRKNVSVVITNPNDGLKNLLVLGYQVILGVKEAISNFSSIYTTAAYTSPHYNFQDSSWLITPFIGFSYDVTANIRLNLTHYSDQQAIWYQLNSFVAGTHWQYYAPQSHQPAWLKYSFTTIYTALECRTLRITQIKERQAVFRNSFEVEILETSQLFNTQDTFQIILDKSYQLINIKIYAKCFTNKSIKSYLNKCNGCLQNQQHQFQHNCYGAINTINFSIKLFPTILAYQELIIIISTIDCQVFQVLYNEEKSQVKLIDIKQIDT